MAKKTVICISGLAGCGKSTLAKKIAEKYGLEYLSGGDALKALAIEASYKSAETGWWETDEGTRFLKQRMEDANFDKKVDRQLIDRAKRQGNVVLDSWTMPWLLDKGFKIWLVASRDVRARRLAERDGIDFKKALEVMAEKDEKTRSIYRKLYGFDLGNDLSPFDLILDTDLLDANDVFRSLCMVIDRLVFEKNPGHDSD